MEVAVTYFKVLSRNFSGGTEEATDNSARIADLWVKIECRISLKESRSARHSVVTFGKIFCIVNVNK
jgi:hypothetical protein